jgi:hypothetical protein
LCLQGQDFHFPQDQRVDGFVAEISYADFVNYAFLLRLSCQQTYRFSEGGVFLKSSSLADGVSICEVSGNTITPVP